MTEFAEASKLALNLILSLDADILEIVILSLKVVTLRVKYYPWLRRVHPARN